MPLDTSDTKSVQDALKRLGYYTGRVDGQFGPQSKRALRALQLDLTASPRRWNDLTAPVDNTSGQLTVAMAAALDEMLQSPFFTQISPVSDPAAANAQALAALDAQAAGQVPAPFLRAVLSRESGLEQFRADGFVVLGLDRNDPTEPDRITSRGYGIGQTTTTDHPLSTDQYRNWVADPLVGLAEAVAHLVTKFEDEVLSADDRKIEQPLLPLRPCRYASSDPRYMADCATCLAKARHVTVRQGMPVYSGASITLEPTQYYATANYGSVPDRASIGCDWPYAIRRYNGGGVNSFHYQILILRAVESGG